MKRVRRSGGLRTRTGKEGGIIRTMGRYKDQTDNSPVLLGFSVAESSNACVVQLEKSQKTHGMYVLYKNISRYFPQDLS